jgi:ketosteroid isomerase-like protein
MNANGIDTVGEIRKIRETDRSLLLAETQRDLVGAMRYIAKDAIFHPPGNPPVIGDEAIRDFYEEWFKVPYSGIVCESDTIGISSSGDLAYLIGNSHMEFDTPTGENRLDGKYITVWRKTSDRWLCVAVSWSGNGPAE